MIETLPSGAADWCNVAAALNGGFLAARNLRGTVCLWDISTRPARIRWSVNDCPGPTGGGKLAFSPDGSRLAVVIQSEQGDAVRLVSTATGRVEQSISSQTLVAVAFSPDGTKLAVASGDNLLLRDVASQRILNTFSGHSSTIEAITFSPDGHLIVSAGKDRNVLLWDVVAGELRFTLTGHRDDVLSVAFSPDGRTLATADRDGCVKFWQVATGRELSEINHEAKPICWVAFSPDGRRLAYLFRQRLAMRIVNVNWTFPEPKPST